MDGSWLLTSCTYSTWEQEVSLSMAFHSLWLFLPLNIFRRLVCHRAIHRVPKVQGHRTSSPSGLQHSGIPTFFRQTFSPHFFHFRPFILSRCQWAKVCEASVLGGCRHALAPCSDVTTFLAPIALYSASIPGSSAEAASDGILTDILLENYRLLTFYSREEPRRSCNSGGKQVLSLILNSDGW